MYAYLRGIFSGSVHDNEEVVVIEVAGIGYEVVVPPIVSEELGMSYSMGTELLLYVSAQSGRDQPWPTLFGFLTLEQKALWQLLISVPRLGGRLASRAMVAPVESIAAAIHEANRAYLDGLPGITLDGADRIIASLRKKVSPLIVTPPPTAIRAPRSERDEMRQDAITLLTQLGARRPEAQRGIDQLLDTREDLTSLQDLITEYFKAQHARTSGTG